MLVKIILICVILVIIAIPTLQVIDSIRDSLRRKKLQRHAQFVEKHSEALQKLATINRKFDFVECAKDFNEYHSYDSEFFYNNISCEDYLIYQLQFKKAAILKEIDNVERNSKLFSQYQEEVDDVREFGIYDITDEKLDKNLLVEIEKDFFDKRVLTPKIEFDIRIVLTYLDWYRVKNQIFTKDEILSLIVRLDNKSNGFYNDREIWDALCRVERGRVSNKMRFSIYRRDGYRCCICGKHGTSHELEIDHIKPIAKGGKSTYDNLQTLCKNCNKLKGDSYPYNKK